MAECEYTLLSMGRNPSVKSIQNKSKSGMFALLLKTVVINGLQAASVLVLARLLSPKDYGTFGILNGWIGVAFFFTDIGMGGFLIQQKSHPSKSQTGSYFAVELILSCSLTAFFWLFSPLLIAYFKMGSSEICMLRILSLTLPIYTLGTVPKMFLQRDMNFGIIAKLDILESLVVYATQIGLAILGFGAWSFVWAACARITIGFILAYFYYPCFYMPVPKWEDIRAVLRFGVPYQLNSILPVLRGIIMPAVLGFFFSVESIGLIFWSLGLTSIPLVVASNYNLVFFSSLSRLQGNKAELRRVASRGIEIMLLGFSYVFGLGATSGAALIDLFFGQKWAEAKAIIPLAALATALIATRHLSTSLLNASGRPHVRLWIEGFAVILEVPILWAAAMNFGTKGYFYSLVAISILALIASAYYSMPYLRQETARRFLSVCGASFLPFILVHEMGFQNRLVTSAVIYTVLFFCTVWAADPLAMTDLKSLIRELKARLSPAAQTGT